MSLNQVVVLHGPESDRPTNTDTALLLRYPRGFSLTSFTDKVSEVNPHNSDLPGAVRVADDLIVDADLLLSGTKDAITLFGAYCEERALRPIGLTLYRGNT